MTMVAVSTLSWEAISAPDFSTPARQAWRAAVAEIAAKAHAKLPECTGRVDAAVKIVLAGDVEVLADGTARVASQSNGQTVYHVVNGQCDCKDFAKAPHGFCKHRLSSAIARRAQELITAQLDAATPASQATPAQPPAPTGPLPEAPASVNVHLEMAGRQVQLTLRDSDEGRLLARLDAVLQRFPLPAAPAAVATRLCALHQVVMTENHKEGRTWWSHKTDNGWCKGR